VAKEFLVYNSWSLLAELGGLIGILLGGSLLSLYDSLADAFHATLDDNKKKEQN